MNWVALGKVALRLVSTAVGITEGNNSVEKGPGKMKRALAIVSDLATNCQELNPQQMLIMSHPTVRDAMQKYAEARVQLENAVAKVTADLTPKS